ncbi:MAG: TIGR03790 family protein [Pirellulales bacterium]
MVRGLTRLRYLALSLLPFVAGSALAGGGPENVLLLVNSNSVDSKTIANHYIALRKIPPTNVVYIDWRGGREGCQGQYFSAQILQPAIKAIGERKLDAQIDYVVYSCDFPWKVSLQPLFPDEKFNQATHPWASINGATYLWQFIRDKNPALVMPITNWYVSPPADQQNIQRCQALASATSRGFRSQFYWAPDGKPTNNAGNGQTYLLSTSLGVTTGRGNTLAEILAYLRRGVEADGTQPNGTFYYMKNGDIRSKTRDGCFDAAAKLLTQLGASALVLPGQLPNGSQEVLGVMTGADTLDIAGAGLKFLPGAIVDNLTSYGGMLENKPWQTPLSDYLRAGATGACGTVFEPLALQAKFPLPSLFIHYARGCSLAESFYQSIAGPYQLLIVGDPLCQPFAVIPEVAVEGLRPGQEVKGSITLQVKATVNAPKQVGTIELFLDGRLVARFTPDRTPQLDTTKLPDGYHEFRFVAVNSDAIESRGRLILPLVVNNHGQKLELSANKSQLSATDSVEVTVRQTGATSIVVRQNQQEVARITGSSGKATVSAATLGRGPVRLQAESIGPNSALSEPVLLEIQ